MSILKNLKNILFSSVSDPRGYTIEVRCDRCGEIITTRLDLYNDLTRDYDADENSSVFFSRKVLIGNQTCFNQILVDLHFNKRRKLVKRSIQGGSFTEDEE